VCPLWINPPIAGAYRDGAMHVPFLASAACMSSSHITPTRPYACRGMLNGIPCSCCSVRNVLGTNWCCPMG
jgi:hypothetical protein